MDAVDPGVDTANFSDQLALHVAHPGGERVDLVAEAGVDVVDLGIEAAEVGVHGLHLAPDLVQRGRDDVLDCALDLVVDPLRGIQATSSGAVNAESRIHSQRMAAEPSTSFFTLTPDRVLDAVEVGGLRCTGRCLPLRAFENRVYEVELEDERRLVVKFYRPGRWSRETILDEHRFLEDLVASEVPAVAPMDLGSGQTLNEVERDLLRRVPARCAAARSTSSTPRTAGASAGRSAACTPSAPRAPRRTAPSSASSTTSTSRSSSCSRATSCPRTWARATATWPCASPTPSPSRWPRPAPSASTATCTGATSSGRPDPLLVDFDDCVMGPPVQDIWLLARGEGEEARKAREDLIEGYELFREFDRSTLPLIEPLRAMRIIYMSGWIAKRWDDPSFPHAFPNFKDVRYWMQEYEALVGISEAIAGLG